MSIDAALVRGGDAALGLSGVHVPETEGHGIGSTVFRGPSALPPGAADGPPARRRLVDAWSQAGGACSVEVGERWGPELGEKLQRLV